MPSPSHTETALEAIKRKDFAGALSALAGLDMANFSITQFLIKGLAQTALLDWRGALDSFSAATDYYPDYALFWMNRGVAEENLDMVDDAIVSHERCLRIDSKQAEAHGNLSNLYRKQRHFVEAETMARRAIELGVDRGAALNSLGLALARQGKFDDAEICYRGAREVAPDSVDVALNSANIAVDRLQFERAWPLFEELQRFGNRPAFQRDEGLARLLAGDYARGYELSESRFDLPHALRLHPTCPMWHGEPLTGKTLLIIAEQGFGDVIQFCRFQAFLPAKAELVWAVPPVLVRLLSGGLRGRVIDETSALPNCDYYVPILSLPLRTKQVEPTGVLPLLTVPARPIIPPGKYSRKIGLVWAGSVTHERDHERSIPFDMMEPLTRAVAADFYAPFTGEAVEELAGSSVQRLDPLLNDFADTAAVLKQLDLLISVDTAVAHLAATLGVPTILLLAHCPDWRWGTTGETTAWYPAMRLLRQPRYGDWNSVIARAADLLKSGF